MRPSWDGRKYNKHVGITVKVSDIQWIDVLEQVLKQFKTAARANGWTNEEKAMTLVLALYVQSLELA